MKASESLHVLSRLLAGMREYASAQELTYECGGWKMCDQVAPDGTVTNFYKYHGEPENLYPLRVTVFALGRAYTVKIDSAKEICHA